MECFMENKRVLKMKNKVLMRMRMRMNMPVIMFLGSCVSLDNTGAFLVFRMYAGVYGA